MLKQKKEKFEFPPSLQSELFNYLKPEQKELHDQQPWHRI